MVHEEIRRRDGETGSTKPYNTEADINYTMTKYLQQPAAVLYCPWLHHPRKTRREARTAQTGNLALCTCDHTTLMVSMQNNTKPTNNQ